MNAELTLFKLGMRNQAESESLESRLARLADSGIAAINAKIKEIDQEFSSHSAAVLGIAALILIGTFVAVTFGGWWLILPVVGVLLMLQLIFQRADWIHYAVQSMGFRSREKIEQERIALKALRGDFRSLPTIYDIEDKDAISRMEGEGGIIHEPDCAKLDATNAMKDLVSAISK